jgi:ubiquinone/menaquinone biosynthesis C-methylase UbiE
MSAMSEVAEHYASGSLLKRIEMALDEYGARRPLDIETLALFDEFHIGGREATERLMKRLKINAGSQVLDMGCGLGGPARFLAKVTTARVTGLDLTGEFVEAGNALTGQALMLDIVDLRQGNLLDMPFKDDQFDVAYMIHVGMNIADKFRLAAEAARVLKPGALFGIYDVMAVDEPELTYPVPWASSPAQSALSTPQEYRDALTSAGFVVESESDWTEMAKDFFARLADQQSKAEGPPILGLHLVMGPDIAEKVRNMVTAIHGRQIAPVQMIARLKS